MAIIAGCIFGFPEDTRSSVIENFRMIKQLKPDMIYAQYLTPYPKTLLRQEMLDAGLVMNFSDYHAYDGFTCNIRTRHLSQTSLYRCLKKEGMKSNFDPSLISVNYFLRKCTLPFLRTITMAVATNIYNVLSARQRSNGLDI